MTCSRVFATQTGGWIGDMVLLDPALRAFRRALPAAHLTLEVRPAVADLMKRHPAVDTVWATDRRGKDGGLHGAWRAARQLRGGAFEAAIIWHPTSVRSALLARLAGIPTRVGHRVPGRGSWLTDSIPDADGPEPLRYLRVLALLGIPVHESEFPSPSFWHSEADRETVRGLADRLRLPRARPRVGIHLGTTWPTKAWLPERLADVARALADQGATIVVTGSEEDTDRRDAFAHAMRGAPYVDFLGVCDLLQLGALLEGCDAYVTVDSGPMHIAAAVGTPVVALFGPTSPLRHGPNGEAHRPLQHDLPCVPCYKRACRLPDEFACMRALTPDNVLRAVRSVLSEGHDGAIH